MLYLLRFQGLLRFPRVVYVRPAFPFDQVLHFGFQVTQILRIGIAIFFNSVDCRHVPGNCAIIDVFNNIISDKMKLRFSTLCLK